MYTLPWPAVARITIVLRIAPRSVRTAIWLGSLGCSFSSSSFLAVLGAG
jgi:hypothetical protein